MGLLTIIRKQKAKDKELRVLVLGLDNAGKTTIVRQLLRQDVEGILPTMGFQISSISYKGYHLNVWDIGGQTSLRGFWGNYFEQTDVVVWVVDGLAVDRLSESAGELRKKVIEQDRLVGVKVIVVINKMDLVENREIVEEQVRQAVGGDGGGNRKFCVISVSGKTGEGLESVMDWCVGTQ